MANCDSSPTPANTARSSPYVPRFWNPPMLAVTWVSRRTRSDALADTDCCRLVEKVAPRPRSTRARSALAFSVTRPACVFTAAWLRSVA